MNSLTWIHIAGGLAALLAGTVAAAAPKGGRAHVAGGRAFAMAMFVLGLTAAIIGPSATPPQSPAGGLMACYFVATGWLAARNRGGQPGAFEKVACAAVLLMGGAMLVKGVLLALGPPVTTPPPPGALIVLGMVCLLAGVGDLRYLLRGTLAPSRRIARHLWRMCFAFFIATGSFFLGQQDVLPAAMRGSPLLFVLAFAPFGLMLVALVQLRRSRRIPPTARPAARGPR